MGLSDDALTDAQPTVSNKTALKLIAQNICIASLIHISKNVIILQHVNLEQKLRAYYCKVIHTDS